MRTCPLLAVVLLAHLCCPGATYAKRELARKLLETWRALDWHVVTVVADLYSSDLEPVLLKEGRGVKLQFTDSHDLAGIPRRPTDSQVAYLTVLIGEARQETCEEVLRTLRMCRGNSVLIAWRRGVRGCPWEASPVPLGFYILVPNEGGFLTLRKVLTTRGKEVMIKDWVQSPRRLRYDISGAHLKMVTLDYFPFMMLGPCGVRPEEAEDGHPLCPEPYGLMVDTIRLVAERANFTYSVHQEASGHWNLYVPSEPDLANWTEGVLKGVVEGENDLPLSPWAFTLTRKVWIDYTFNTYTMRYKCFANGDILGSKTNLLLKPFTCLSWIFVVLFLFLLKGCLNLITKAWKPPESSDAAKMVSLSSGMLAVLVNAFYAGALTMFLASKADLPFDSIFEGLNQDSWQLLMSHGDERTIENNFDLSKYPRLREKHEYLVSKEHMEQDRRIVKILQQLQTEPTRYLITYSSRVHWAMEEYRNNVSFTMVEFCQSMTGYGALILPKNSPYRDALNAWILKLKDSGLLSQFEREWMRYRPKKIAAGAFKGQGPINLGQVLYVFVAGGVIVAVVLLTLAMEKMANRLNRLRNTVEVYCHAKPS